MYESLPRQGPGKRDCAARALRLCAGLPRTPVIVDLGCGDDAISYMSCLIDFAAAFSTAHAHMNPGGVLVTTPHSAPDLGRWQQKDRTKRGGTIPGIDEEPSGRGPISACRICSGSSGFKRIPPQISGNCLSNHPGWLFLFPDHW